MLERVEVDKTVGGAECGWDDIHIMTGLPHKNMDKFSLDDSTLWKTDEDGIAR